LIWLTAIASLAIVAACGSIWGTIDDRRDIATGRPSFETLVSYTGVWNRGVFVQLLGEPNTKDRFALSTEQLRELPSSAWVRLFDNMLFDVLSIMLSGAAPVKWLYNSTMAVASLALGAGMQVAGYGIAAIVTYRSGVWHKWLVNDGNDQSGNEQSVEREPE
jgi:hypothetical protein